MYVKYIKRLLDIILAMVFLPFISVLFVILIPVIYFSDRGTPFYNAKRLGKDGRIFTMYKLRSMKVNAPDLRNEDGSTYNSDDDPRLTKVGKFIRKTSVDELPQIFNVLKGDMSFIGPRPDLPEHYSMYDDYETKKLGARPGISGYSQAYFRNSIEWRDRLRKDIFYVENASFALDVRIFFKTIKMVIKKDGVYVITPEKERV